MKLRAEFVVDVTAIDFVQAADHQKRLAEFLQTLKTGYADATLTIRERRKPRPVRAALPPGMSAAAE